MSEGQREGGAAEGHSPEELGRSYAALLGEGAWDVDAPPPAAGEGAEPAPPSPVRIIEAMLFVGGAPLTAARAGEVIRGLTPEQFRECIDVLNRVYRSQNRPYSVVHGTTGYVLRVSRKYAAVRERLHGGPREARLNQQALDVLSLVAYRQPVGKAEIDGARGVDSGAVLRQLVRLGLLSSETAEDGSALFRTTARFLEVFRLRGLDDLPELGEPTRVP